MIHRILNVMSRILGSDASTALIAQHAGHADAHDVALVIGIGFVALVGLVFRRRRTADDPRVS